jgi:hypothetical protein
MGYVVSSIAAIGSDDYHVYFVYYAPTRLLQYEWINGFFKERFFMIADKIGPTGVIITPTLGAEEGYTGELLDATWGMGEKWAQRARFLDAGFPFLIMSRGPIDPRVPAQTSDEDEPNFVALNLAAARDESELAGLIDTLIQACLRGEEDVLPLVSGLSRNLSGEYDGKYGVVRMFSEALELKPNVMGLGVNINSILQNIPRIFKVRRARNIEKRIGPLQ